MGTGAGKGLNFGNSVGARREQQNIALKYNHRIINESELIAELEEKGIKFTKEDMLFITKDKTGQTVWLEKGNSGAGLTHIEQRHGQDFLIKQNIRKEDIVQHLRNIYTYGNVEYSRITTRNNIEGCEKLYCYKENYYILSGIGTNGFVVSAYPIDENVARKLIKRYKK